MNALTQYIELYEHHGETIRSHAPAALNRRRAAALATLKRLGRLPQRGDEGYQAVSVSDIFAPDMGLNLMRRPVAGDPRSEISCALPGLGSLNALLVNDTFVAGRDLEASLPEGVEVMSLARAAEIYPDDVLPGIVPEDNAVAALNTLLVQDGVYVRVAPGVQLDTPIQILSVFAASQPMMAVRRIRVSVGEGARAAVLLCDHPRERGAHTVSCRVVECSVERDGRLDMYDLEEAGADNGRASVLASRQMQGSRLGVTSVYLSGGVTRNDYIISHAGEHCHTSLGGLVIAGGEQTVDNAVTLTHSQPRCTSEQLFKYALFDSSRCAFEGLVTVEPGAVYTDARQTDRNLLISPDARMHAEPQLVINCDEVKASHGAATGQLDEEALFYMRSRGIPEAEARMMLTNAFLTDVLDNIHIEALRDRLRHLVDKRLRGCGTVCDKCNISHDLRR